MIIIITFIIITIITSRTAARLCPHQEQQDEEDKQEEHLHDQTPVALRDVVHSLQTGLCLAGSSSGIACYYLSTYLKMYLSTYLFIYPSIYLYMYLNILSLTLLTSKVSSRPASTSSSILFDQQSSVKCTARIQSDNSFINPSPHDDLALFRHQGRHLRKQLTHLTHHIISHHIIKYHIISPSSLSSPPSSLSHTCMMEASAC